MRLSTKIGLALILAVSAAALSARAAGGVCVQASSGHPYQSTSTWSSYFVQDDTVSFQSRAWAIPVPLDNSGAAHTYQVTGVFYVQKEATAWVFDSWGNVQGGYTLTSGSATKIALPAGSYTMFARVTGVDAPAMAMTVAHSVCTRY